MMILLAVVFVIAAPSLALAWGPMTHLYLGNELLACGAVIPPAMLALIRKYRHDFVYGNLMADMIIGKKHLPDAKSSHAWDQAYRLLGQAETGPEKAFMYGYLCHLAADTVAHETLTEDKHDVGHTWEEIKADSIIEKSYWLQYLAIKRQVKRRGDRLLEDSLESLVFSVRTNRRIFKSMVFLSFLNRRKRRGIDHAQISALHAESIARMLAVLKHGRRSSVTKRSPL